jgi:hypothetical protein
MPTKYDILPENEQDPQKTSQEIVQELELFLSPLLLILDTFLDKRLIRTLVQCCVAIIRFRNNKQGLLLSELGSYMDNYQGLSVSAAAGTKRVGNLIRSLKWNIFHIDNYLLDEANKEVKRLKDQGKRILCLWDGSVIEKPESSAAEGLCPVVSSKAKRLNRIRKGHVFNLPTLRPALVTGMHWTGALIAGLEGVPKIALMSWWTTKGDYQTRTRIQEEEMLRKCVKKWGDILVHVFDRGYASGPWIHLFQSLKGRFVIRWIKKHTFFDRNGEEKNYGKLGEGKDILRIKRFLITPLDRKCPVIFGGQPYGMQIMTIHSIV